jgi:hypothetical protein
LVNSNVFVEFFGLSDKKEYKEKMKKKIEFSKMLNFKLISIFPIDLNDKQLNKIFNPYIK